MVNKIRIAFIGNARCYHTLDWYRCISSIYTNERISFLTDLIDSESHPVIIDSDVQIINLFNIDRFLFKTQCRLGDIWRNLIKLIVIPIQLVILAQFARSNQNLLLHAHTMYYMFLCFLAKVDYIGTPQGSEVLIRPFKSKLYYYFARKCLRGARYITVDSKSMAATINNISGVDAVIIQNGINVTGIQKLAVDNFDENKALISLRGMSPLYRIKEIAHSRNLINLNIPLHFIYPFEDFEYKVDLMKDLKSHDKLIGRLSRVEMYKLLKKSRIAISIPVSDSSPRSVYEAIFCNCLVICSPNDYLYNLPACMRSRVYIADLNNPIWLKDALEWASSITDDYIPSKLALSTYDQEASARRVLSLYDIIDR
jgi:hypothetical protein